jgi:hypothetical protein
MHLASRLAQVLGAAGLEAGPETTTKPRLLPKRRAGNLGLTGALDGEAGPMTPGELASRQIQADVATAEADLQRAVGRWARPTSS